MHFTDDCVAAHSGWLPLRWVALQGSNKSREGAFWQNKQYNKLEYPRATWWPKEPLVEAAEQQQQKNSWIKNEGDIFTSCKRDELIHDDDDTQCTDERSVPYIESCVEAYPLPRVSEPIIHGDRWMASKQPSPSPTSPVEYHHSVAPAAAAVRLVRIVLIMLQLLCR